MKFFSALLLATIFFGSIATASPVHAVVSGMQSNTIMPYSRLVRIPCTNLPIRIQGKMHIQTTLTENGSGGLHITIHSNPQAMSGSDSAGNLYQVNGTSNVSNFSSLDAAFVINTRAKFTVIGRANGVRFDVENTLHITGNADGAITAVVTRSETFCSTPTPVPSSPVLVSLEN
jgi:hypothetical protein